MGELLVLFAVLWAVQRYVYVVYYQVKKDDPTN